MKALLEDWYASGAPENGWWGYPGWYNGFGTADYNAIINSYNIGQRVQNGEIDEVFIQCHPMNGLYESRMAGDNAYWCNAPALVRSDISREFIIMGFNYERDVGCMLEDFCHRTESIMAHVYGRWDYNINYSQMNTWEKFSLYDEVASGNSACGNCHFAPNSTSDYDWGSTVYVQSTCDDWLNYPNLTGIKRSVNCLEWGNGDMRLHHIWWLSHVPKADGISSDSKLSNWWLYICYSPFSSSLTSPVLIEPAKGITLSTFKPTFTWNPVIGATSYQIKVSKNADCSSALINTTVSGTTFTPVTDLSSNTKYYWEVRAKNLTSNGPYSAIWNFTTTAPVALTPPTLTAPSDGEVLDTVIPTLIWYEVPSSTSYKIQVSKYSNFSSTVVSTSVTETSYTPSNLSKATKYYWRVLSKNSTNKSAYSTVFSFTTATPPVLVSPILSEPANGSTVTNLKPTFTWQPITGATSYKIQVSKYSNFSSTVISTTVSGTSYASPGLSAGKTYYWRVLTKSSDGKSPYSAVWSFKAP